MLKEFNSSLFLAMGLVLSSTIGLAEVAPVDVPTTALVPVCERTPAVRAGIEEDLRKPCAEITEEDLLKVKRVAAEDGTIKEFKAGDLGGLRNLEILNIRSNPYTEIPEGLFNDLVNLKTLVIIGGKLRHYPDDFLAHSPLIENLHLFRIQVRSISESVFQRLEKAAPNLKELDFDKKLNEAEKERLMKLFPKGGKTVLSLI